MNYSIYVFICFLIREIYFDNNRTFSCVLNNCDINYLMFALCKKTLSLIHCRNDRFILSEVIKKIYSFLQRGP